MSDLERHLPCVIDDMVVHFGFLSYRSGAPLMQATKALTESW